jgi:drug/metabolite transporter (DMT)-like permease
MLEILLVVAEFLLGAYTVLIKLVPTNLETQTLARMLTYTIGSIIVGLATGRLTTPSFEHLLTMGSLNAVHIGSSYLAFKELSPSTALSLFYTYPFINLLFSNLFLGEKINLGTLPWLAVSFIGSLLVLGPSLKASALGTASIAISAITESLIYIAFRSKYEKTELEGIFHLYGGGLIAILLARLLGFIKPFDTSLANWKPLLSFNLLIGFVAYSLVFGIISKIPPEVFAAFAFVGIISGYVYSEFTEKKRPEIPTYIGSALIATSAFFVRRYFT